MPAKPQVFNLWWTSGPVGKPVGPGKQLIRDVTAGDSLRLLYLQYDGQDAVDASTLTLGLVMSKTIDSAPELTIAAARFHTFTDATTGKYGFYVDILEGETGALEAGSHIIRPLDLTSGTGHALALDEIWLLASAEYTPGIGPALGYRAANTVLAGPASGADASPSFRMLVAADVPGLSGTYLPLSGGTLAGPLVGTTLSMSGLIVTNDEIDCQGFVCDGIVVANAGQVQFGAISTATQIVSSSTAPRTITLPDAAGTVALTSDLTTLAPLVGSTINAQTGTSYALVLSDAGKTVTLSNAAAITLSVPAASTVAWLANSRIDLAQIGAGQVTISPASGVTVSSKSGNLKITGQYSGATLLRTGTNAWLLVGDLSS